MTWIGNATAVSGTGRLLKGLLAAALLFPACGVSAKTAWVSGSISEAVAAANEGDTLLVPGPAVYHEHVKLDRRLTLLGTNAPVLDGGCTGTVLTIEASGTEVHGLVVRNGGADLGDFNSGIMVRAPGVVVANCRVEGGGFGIYIRGVDGCRVEANTVLGNTNVPPSKRGNGIHLWKTKNNRVLGNSISATRDGAYFSYADRNLIASNRIENTRFGIHYMYSHHNELLNNTLLLNAVGAALMFARDCRVEGNLAFSNRRHGILLKQVEYSRFYRNSVYGQNRGFFIQQAVEDRFEQNVIVRNDIGLYLSNGSEKNVFIGNVFSGNTDQVWQPQDEFELGRQSSNAFSQNRRGNFWSDYTGSDDNGDGIGDTPYHETTLFGYIIDRHPEARVFASSPAAALLRKGEEVLPILNVEGVTDMFPLHRLPAFAQTLLPRTALTKQ